MQVIQHNLSDMFHMLHLSSLKMRTLASVEFDQSSTKYWLAEDRLHRHLQQNSIYSYPDLHQPLFSTDHALEASGFTANTPTLVRSFNWSCDGSSFVTISSDFAIRHYVLPVDLMERSQPNDLIPLTRLFQPSPILAYSLNPQFSMYSEAETSCNVLISLRNLPIKLLSLLPTEASPAMNSYKFELDEKSFNSSALAFGQDASHFVAGSTNTLAIFDLTRSWPISSSRHRTGMISAIVPSSSSSKQIFLGSYNSNVSIFDGNSNEMVQTVNLRSVDKQGTGVTQLLPSSNDHYLFVLQRKTNQIIALDLRMNLKKVATLHNWLETTTNQRLSADLLLDSDNLIAGSQNGVIKLWKQAQLGVDCDSETFLDTRQHSVVSCVDINSSTGFLGVTYGSRDDYEDSDTTNKSGIQIYEI